MEYQSTVTDHSGEGTVASVLADMRQTARRVRCSLPTGTSMLCGNARHREDRAADSEVIVGGAPSRDIWFIRSGILRLQCHAYDGRRQILSLFLPGEVVGFEGEFREGVSVETVTQSGLCRIDRRAFDAILNGNDELRAELFRQKQDQLDRLHWLTWSLGALSPDERFAAFLAMSTRFMPCDPLPDGTTILSMQLPRADIADLLGTTVETICRINRKLSESGVIEIKDPSHFRILDLKQLMALGQIEGGLDRMVRGIVERRSRLDDLMGPASGSAVCNCGS
ncbi:Crp/Fnr family transcriptional regulator [Cypionkella sp.]|uniref:Crp/Fnr family transcriptional regulator n=1 Tax=Cypionkella sp. TaxID=2811411 RepID=UPI002715C1E2|nr:Crp/Fnr family transcriptional regulator [Cypionkella sp.]MDO8985987.1 Crp/Fnr family transcriptional regulator [Cypionkella sp.]MDP1577784.1 Crp/Fnr family transcriptional regulator [Cypionkella sp.]MDP2048175.1 Crp/Fnr family transcriptional regulator [Cypionkella sp.]